MRYGLALCLGLSVLGAACQGRSEPCAEPVTDAGRPVDVALLSFLSRARAAHHAADGAEQAADLPAAARFLEALVDGPLPKHGESTAEVREVLADSLARLGDLASRQADFERAERHLERALALVPGVSYFRGHVYEVWGVVWERRAASLREQGDAAGAERARARALESLEAAMKIQADVIRKELP